MDPRTPDFYRTRAVELTERYEAVSSSVTRHFATAFATGSRVLGVGTDFGRGLAALVAVELAALRRGIERRSIEAVGP